MVTFTKTTLFSRMTSTPFANRKNAPAGAPHDKYTSGKASVKGLHYLRFIGLELLSESAFTLTFHKFFSNEVKGLIRSISDVKFSPELRAWVLPITHYDSLMQELTKICLINNIHIEDIPAFAMKLMTHKTPNFQQDDQ
jgi:hypothetical protein